VYLFTADSIACRLIFVTISYSPDAIDYWLTATVRRQTCNKINTLKDLLLQRSTVALLALLIVLERANGIIIVFLTTSSESEAV